ncbi:MAG: PTH1 family peptidyl-tRNA hydrolase [Acidimicrobiales bacterium]
MSLLSRRPGEKARRGKPSDFLIIGLGNPGAEFEHTRHNVGADCVAMLAKQQGRELEKKSKERAFVAEVLVADKRVALAFPQTFMNNSGEAVRLLARRHGIETGDQLVIVHDELDLEIGRLKLKQGGGMAGHNGLKSVTQHVGTTDFARLRIGVGKPPVSQAGRDYVLRRPSKADQILLDISLQRAVDALVGLVTDGLDATMAVVNRRPDDAS